MKEFEFHQHEKAVVWLRHSFTVTAPTQEEAEEFIRAKGLVESCAWHDEPKDSRIAFIGTETLFETQSEITVEENDGWPTIEIQAPDRRHIADNCRNRNYKAENDLWRDEALALIRERFDAPEEKVTEFVDGNWEADAPDDANLFNFDLWIHGCDRFRRNRRERLWAFTYPMDMGEDITDGEIVAAYHSPENRKRLWPVAKMTPAEFADRVNKELFADTELFVRFIRL